MAFVTPTPARAVVFRASQQHLLCAVAQSTYQPQAPQTARRALHMAAAADEEESVSLSDLNKRLKDAQAAQAAPSIEAAAAAAEPPPADVDAPLIDPSVDPRSEKQKEIDRLRAAEKFIEVDEGKYECTACGFVYDPARGDSKNNITAGTLFDDLPDSYTCPACRTPKRRFVSKKKIIAGFAENQVYGLGSNSLTGGEKSLLIFGGLVVAVLLLLSGYALN